MKTISRSIQFAIGKLVLVCILIGFSVNFWMGVKCTSAAIATAPSTPQLNLILPRGVQRGGERTLNFLGERLQGTEEVFLYDHEAGIAVTNIKQVDNKNVEVTINVPDNCRLGEHVAQIRTRSGITEFRSFFIGALPGTDEVEPNNSLEEAQSIDLGVTVAGVADNEDIDYYRITGKKDQRVSVEIEAIRLGYMFDPAIAIMNSERFEIAVSDDTPLTKQDGWVSVRLPADGDYFITVRESSFRGNGDCRYRLHVGDFPRPAAVYPAGGRSGDSVHLKFIEKISGSEHAVNFIEKEIEMADGQIFRNELFYDDDRGISPSPVPFRFSKLDNSIEQEPNNNWSESQLFDLLANPKGVAVNGIIEAANDMDYYQFHANEGQVYYCECLARGIGSGLDPVMHIFDSDKKTLAGNDDNGNPDSFIRFQAPADGDYYLRIYDHLKRGQVDFIYRVEISSAVPELSIGITRNDRYSQNRQTIAVPQGGRFAVLVDATRKDFGGEIELLNENLPPGITMIAPSMKDNLNSMPVVFEAAADAEISGKLIDFLARPVDQATGVTGHFKNFSDFVLGEPNNRVYYGCTVNELAVAVIEPLPFRLELVQPKVPLVRDGSIKLKVIAHRDEGFDQPIHLQFPFRGPGVGTTNQIMLPKEQTELEYPLDANGSAQLGKWPMYVIGTADVNGPAWLSTQMAELEVAEPLVKMEFERASVELGQPVTLYCKIEQLIPFEGEATAEIFGAPPKITIDSPLNFNKDSTELSFAVETTAESPVGKHGLFCQVTIMQNGEPIVARAGNVELQITAPLPPKVEPEAEP